jgi:ABC-type glycerol-3-phosphate transport system substrate-binding protein
MKKAAPLLAALFVFLIAASAPAAGPAKVEILFMNHGPLRSTIENIRDIAAKYEGKINVEWYDFDSRETVQFMESKGLDGHIPLIIWINGSVTQKIDGTDVSFQGFPSGSGPAMFRGAWDMEMLDKALDQATR